MADLASGSGSSANRLVREFRRATARFANVTATSFARDLWRAATIGRRVPALSNPPNRHERVVVTLTTTAARAHGLRPVIASLLDQTEQPDRIVLALPRRSLSGAPYPDIATLNLPAGVETIECDDIGPATKLLPALRAEPDAVLIVVDDDVIYPDRFVETLLRAHRENRQAAFGYRGVCLMPGTPFRELDHVFASGVSAETKVDVLFGTWGYLVPPGALGDAVHDLAAAPEGVRWVDDVWISGHLARAGVPRFVPPADQFPIETLATMRGALTSGVNKSGENDEIALRLFAGDW